MIAKITSGNNFKRIFSYLMNLKREKRKRGQERQSAAKQKERFAESFGIEGEGHAPAFAKGQRHRLIGGNMSGQSARELAHELEAVRAQRPNISKPVHHVSLTAAKGERLTIERWQQIASKYIEEMGFNNAPYVVVQHRDTDHDHIHIVTSRIDLEGKVITEWQSKRRAEKIMRAVEREYGLQRIKPSSEVNRAAPKRGEIETFNRTGKLSAKMIMQGRVEQALKDSPTVTEFIERLRLTRVEVIPNLQRTGRVSGISFRHNGELMKGSDLGRGFSWGALQKRGLDYDQERDRSVIEAMRVDAGFSSTYKTTVQHQSLDDLTKRIGRAAGQHLLNQMNPVKQVKNEFLRYKYLAEDVVNGVNFAKDLFAKQDSMEELRRTAGIEPIRDEDEAVERLNKAMGEMPATFSNNETAQTPDEAQALDREVVETDQEAPSAVEQVVESEVEEQAAEVALELLL